MKSELNVKRLTAYFYSLGYFLAIIFSLTFLFPWAFMRYHGWLVNNTKINEKKLVFDGRTKHLYLIYFTGIILAAIIYSVFFFGSALVAAFLEKNGYNTDYLRSLVYRGFLTVPGLLLTLFITCRFYKYRNTHTHYEGYNDTKSGLKLQLYKIVLSSIIFKAITVLTSFIGYPFALNIRERFLQSRRYIDGDDLKFKGSIGRICLIWFIGIILSIITLTFYIPYLFFSLNKYIIANTILKIDNTN